MKELFENPQEKALQVVFDAFCFFLLMHKGSFQNIVWDRKILFSWSNFSLSRYEVIQTVHFLKCCAGGLSRAAEDLLSGYRITGVSFNSLSVPTIADRGTLNQNE